MLLAWMPAPLKHAGRVGERFYDAAYFEIQGYAANTALEPTPITPCYLPARFQVGGSFSSPWLSFWPFGVGAMNITDILSEWVLPLLLYSGAVVPLTAALYFDRHSERRHRHHRRLFIVMLAVQAVSFLPFLLAAILGLRDAIHALTLPAGVGAILFLWGLFVLGSECVRRLDAYFAEPGASPKGGPTGPSGSSGADKRAAIGELIVGPGGGVEPGAGQTHPPTRRAGTGSANLVA